MLPSLFTPGDKTREWSLTRAAAYGAAVGVLAGSFRTLGPLRQAGSASAHLAEIFVAAFAFAALCAGAAALRNFIARRLIWPEIR
jgi:hypothetical protein